MNTKAEEDKDELTDNEKDNEKDYINRNFIILILALASEKKQQIEFVYPGCPICELIEDLYTYNDIYSQRDDFPIYQKKAIEDLKELMDELNNREVGCSAIIDGPMWQGIRDKAQIILKSLGYKIEELPKSKNKNGIWMVDNDELKLERIEQ